MSDASPSGAERYRAIWISDIHLGTRGCRADLLLDFLRRTESERLYLVGDILDGWRLRRSWYWWGQAHNDVVQKLLRKARKGTKVVLIPGNHDELLRDYVGWRFGGVQVLREAVHRCADGRKLLVTHGDDYDAVVQLAPLVARLGSWAYDAALALNTLVAAARRRLGYPYWSFSAYLKRRVKNAVQFICRYEEALAGEARRRGLDGVVCGHIHHPEIREIGGVLYCNDGDWVESCSALVETESGELKLVRWAERGDRLLEPRRFLEAA